MTQVKQVYKCGVCGNVVEMVHAGAGALVCCGQEMVLQQENTVDAAMEKHVPVIEEVEGGVSVRVGEIAHPMEAEHYIEWIEILLGEKIYRAHLEPGQEPTAIFPVKYSKDLEARAYCNIHSLWATKNANPLSEESSQAKEALVK